MTHETTTPEKKALLEAFDTVLKTQAEEREAQRLAEEERRRARARSRPVMGACAAITLFLGAYLWIEQPDWVFPSQAPPESSAVKEASLRIGMANAAQHLERYRQRHGRLPATLPEAGAYGEDFDYQVGTTGTEWQITAQAGATRLVLTSTERLPEFLGNSFEVISRRGR